MNFKRFLIARSISKYFNHLVCNLKHCRGQDRVITYTFNQTSYFNLNKLSSPSPSPKSQIQVQSLKSKVQSKEERYWDGDWGWQYNSTGYPDFLCQPRSCIRPKLTPSLVKKVNSISTQFHQVLNIPWCLGCAEYFMWDLNF